MYCINCKSSKTKKVISIGNQVLSGIFPLKKK